jgi:hypothetical protein
MRALAKRVGFYVRWEEAEAALRKGDMFNVTAPKNARKVDLIVRKSREFSVSEFERRESVEIDGLDVVITSAEDILIAKLEWFKVGESVEKWVESLGLDKQWRECSLALSLGLLSQIAQGDLTARRRSAGPSSLVNRRRFAELNPAF